MMKPTIHLNGTSRSELAEQNHGARLALRAALAKMQMTCPNGRDYYVQGPNAHAKAVEEHVARCKQINDVLTEYDELAEHIADAPGQGQPAREG